MKKILVWETSHFVAGGQKVTLKVLNLMKNECEFCCLIPQKGPLSEELDRLGIPYFLMGDQTLPSGVKGKKVYFRYAWMSVKSVFRSLSAIRKFRPDILYAPGPAALPWSAICGALSGKPVIWHLHHVFLDGPTKKLLNICAKWKAVTKIAAVSGVVGDQITCEKGRSKMQVMYNPVDFSSYSSGDPSVVDAEMQQILGTSEREFLLTSVAVLRRDKRQNVLLEIVRILREKGLDAKCVLVGEAVTDEDRKFKAELEQQIVEEGLTGVAYLAGYRTNVRDYLAAVDMVMIPALFEGLSLVALETMSAGRDIAAPENGGTEELLNAANCGVLYPFDATPEDIADAILRSRQTDRSEALKNGQAFCRTLTPENYREKLRNLFLEA